MGAAADSDPAGRTDGRLEYILCHCRYPEDSNAALLLFRLAAPGDRVKPNHLMRAIDSSCAPDVDLELGTVGDDYWTREHGNVFRPNLQEFVGPLATIAAAHLEETALLPRLTERTGTLSRCDSPI